MSAGSNPVVSIIVPARNEEANLAACLESLVTQTGIPYEIIVVDDASTDRTAEIARSFSIESVETPSAYSNNLDCGAAGVPARVISAPPLPANWTGKNNAMSAGAKAANPNAKWLLFTDADTVHAPGSLARAVAEADQQGAALLSYSPAQEVHGFWEKAVMPVIFAELATTYPPQAVNDPASPIAAANGQYLMISREAYDAVGGHTTLAADLLEDVAMARIVKLGPLRDREGHEFTRAELASLDLRLQPLRAPARGSRDGVAGRKIFFRYAPDAVRTRMYRTFAQLREGWTKNLALLFPRPRALALLRMAEFLLIVGNLSAAIWAKFSGRPNLAVQTALLTIILSGWFAMRICKAHFPALSSFLGLLGLPVFSALLMKSASVSSKGGIVWKGREYQSPAPKVAPSQEVGHGRAAETARIRTHS